MLPLTPSTATLTPPPVAAALANTLTPAQIDQYRRDGYVVVESLFSKGELARTRDVIDEMTRAAIASGADYKKVLELEPELIDGQRVARRIYDPFEQHEQFRALATSPKMLDRVEALIGPDLMIHHSKLNMKPPRVGSAVEWHQDLTYFPHTNSDLVTTLVYLDDATPENGCLQVLPGEHHRFFNHANPDGSFAGMITEDFLKQSPSKPVPLSAPAGSVIFMSCILPHASLPNRSPDPRRTLIYEFRAADAFSIYFGPKVLEFEKKAHLVRGTPATHARCEAGFNPPIPNVGAEMKSLYEVQLEAKKRATAHM
ncbi:MAG TPA: phytanoyl-CoA dioxygenase family protein [Planctomycetota bacterium]|nr:phytanoyl-CoA dioxygenase family protein [Planctomycetota bacterium]